MNKPVSLQVLDHLADLQAKCAEATNTAEARKWREAISGVCIDQTTQLAICVEENGVQHTKHWLLDWLNARLKPGPASIRQRYEPPRRKAKYGRK